MGSLMMYNKCVIFVDIKTKYFITKLCSKNSLLNISELFRMNLQIYSLMPMWPNEYIGDSSKSMNECISEYIWARIFPNMNIFVCNYSYIFENLLQAPQWNWDPH